MPVLVTNVELVLTLGTGTVLAAFWLRRNTVGRRRESERPEERGSSEAARPVGRDGEAGHAAGKETHPGTPAGLRRAAAVAAAIQAYLEAEATAAGLPAASPARTAAVRSAWAARTPPTGLGWAQAGRIENMLARQQLYARKGPAPR
ncbi:MAG: hypothetical protein K6U08_05705 [Firmicutes bacterium]|nr:hypothetical protein [Bacillota bacterium]